MKQTVRFLSLGLTAVLCLAMLLCGCSGDAGESSGSGGSRGEIADLAGKEITFSGSAFYMPEDENSEEYEEMASFKAEVESLFNCKITIVVYEPWDVYAQKIQDMTMSGDHMADVISFDQWLYPKIMLTGILLPIQDYVPLTDAFYDAEAQSYWSYNGNTYAVSPVAKTVPDGWLVYNKTLFEGKGLDSKYNLTELVKNRQWTWEKFREVMRDSTIDSDGDGETDIYGLAGTGLQFGRLTNYFVRSNGGTYAVKDGNRVTLTIEDPKFMRALEFMHQLTWEDKVIPTEDRWRGYANLTHFANGECMFYAMINHYIGQLKTMTMDGEMFSILPMPIGPDAGGEYINFCSGVNMYGMPATTENRAEAGMVLDYWLRNKPDRNKDVRETWSDMVYDTESLDVIEMLADMPHKLDLASWGYTSLNTLVLSEHEIVDRTPPATLVAAYKDAIESEIRQLWSLAE